MEKFKRTSIALMLILSMFLFSLASSVAPVTAAVIPSYLSNGSSASARQAEMETIRQFLEMKMVQEKLKALGLDDVQATQKLSELSDEEVHKLASHIDKLAVAGEEFEEGEKKVIVYSIAVMGILAAVLLLAIIIS